MSPKKSNGFEVLIDASRARMPSWAEAEAEAAQSTKKRRQQIFRLVAPNSNHKWMLYLPVVVVLVVGTSKVVCLALLLLLLLLLSVRLTVNNRKTRARI